MRRRKSRIRVAVGEVRSFVRFRNFDKLLNEILILFLESLEGCKRLLKSSKESWGKFKILEFWRKIWKVLDA